MTLLEATFALLEQEYQQAGRGDLYRLLQPSLAAQADAPSYATVAAALANAVFDATGARLRTVPFTRERVKATLDGV